MTSLEFCIKNYQINVMWDVGAHHGGWSLSFPKARVYAIEPDICNAAILILKTFNLPNITVFPLAFIPDNRERVQLIRTIHSTLSSTVNGWAEESGSKGIETTEVLSRNYDFFYRLFDGAPDLLKIDCEGLDAEIVISIMNSGQPKPNIIVWETAGKQSEKARELLKTQGFQLIKAITLDGARNINDEIWKHDA